jgi:hypothetical protein
VELVEEVLGERPGRILDALEVERLIAGRRPDNVCEAVGFECFGGPVAVERTVVVGVAEDQVVGTGIVGRVVALGLVSGEIAVGRFASLVRLPFEQWVLRQFLGDEGLELEIAELEQLDRLRQLGREHQLLRLADA